MSEVRKTVGRKHVKKGITSVDARRQRYDTKVKLRKEKKMEGLAKRRAMISSVAPSEESVSSKDLPIQGGIMPATENDVVGMMDSSDSSNVKEPKRIIDVSDIPALLHVLQERSSSSRDDILDAARGFRKILAKEKSPPVKEVIASGVLPILVELLSYEEDEQVQFEAAWALTNIASTEHTVAIVDCGAVGPLVSLLMSPYADVREQSAWCLGNVAGDSPRLRDLVLQAGALPPLLQNISQPASDSLLSNVVWALSNFCRGKPQPSLEIIGAAIPFLSNLLQQPNKDIVMDACWALSYLSDGGDDRIQAVIDGGVVPTLVFLLGNESSSLITPALRTLGNLVSGDDHQTQVVVESGVLQHAGALLTHTKRNIKKETCWLLSNIAAGTREQINALAAKPRELSIVIASVLTAEWEVRKEATWVVSNIATGGADVHIQGIVELGAIKALCAMLTVADPKIVMVAMDAVEAILRVGEKLGKAYDYLVDEADGLEKIEGLQEHANEEIYEKAVNIIENYFGGNEVDDENIIPEANINTFNFGVKQLTDTEEQGQPMQPFNFS